MSFFAFTIALMYVVVRLSKQKLDAIWNSKAWENDFTIELFFDPITVDDEDGDGKHGSFANTQEHSHVDTPSGTSSSLTIPQIPNVVDSATSAHEAPVHETPPVLSVSGPPIPLGSAVSQVLSPTGSMEGDFIVVKRNVSPDV